MAKDTYYFSHDYDTRNDEKVMDLMTDMGWEGYGLFWGVVELLYQNEGKMRTHYKRIAFAMQTDESRIADVIEKYGLFKIEDNYFWSESVIKRLAARTHKSEKARESALSRWRDANALRSQCDSNAIKERKGKEKKEKEERDFEVFWDSFHAITRMDKTDKAPALKHWAKLCPEDQEKALANIPPYFDNLREKKYCKKARTYLSDRNFDDEYQHKEISEGFEPKPGFELAEGWNRGR